MPVSGQLHFDEVKVVLDLDPFVQVWIKVGASKLYELIESSEERNAPSKLGPAHILLQVHCLVFVIVYVSTSGNIASRSADSVDITFIIAHDPYVRAKVSVLW